MSSNTYTSIPTFMPHLILQVFRVFDTDKNGRLDFHEFMLAISIQQKGSTEDRLGWLFNMFDLDGTGFISMDELTTLVEVGNALYVFVIFCFTWIGIALIYCYHVIG